jgi:glycosyltransferase involved in cell wall biosynthesis
MSLAQQSCEPLVFQAEAPQVTVVVATRNRGGRVAEALRSILANSYASFSIRVVDQSDDDRTRASLAPFLPHGRVRYHHTATVGVSIARNLGISLASSELVAITDDDCLVPADWLGQMVQALTRDERIAIVFGSVVPVVHDTTAGFVPGYQRDEPFLARSLAEKHDVEGLSACMGLRRSAWQRLGGFDPLLGVGGRFRAGAEGDLTLRALREGYYVYETPLVNVRHVGYRDGREARATIRRCWFGTGAMYARNLKVDPLPVLSILMRMGRRYVFGQSRYARSLGARPHRFLQWVSFVRGFAAGLLTPLCRPVVARAPDRSGRVMR